MTIHRERHGILFECDGCSNTLDTETKEWERAKQLLDTEKWKAEKVGTDWLHLCPSCQKRK
jgi:Fe2+ or Zn2+ uptake regulation protein